MASLLHAFSWLLRPLEPKAAAHDTVYYTTAEVESSMVMAASVLAAKNQTIAALCQRVAELESQAQQLEELLAAREGEQRTLVATIQEYVELAESPVGAGEGEGEEAAEAQFEAAAARFQAKARFWQARLESAARLTPSRPPSPEDEPGAGSPGEEVWHTPSGEEQGVTLGGRAGGYAGGSVQAAIEAAAGEGDVP